MRRADEQPSTLRPFGSKGNGDELPREAPNCHPKPRASAGRLAASPAVKDLPRDAARSAEIVKMALEAAEDTHLPAGV